MADYPINRGIGKPVEFKGLKSQYLFIFAGGLLALFVLFIIMYMVGINQWVCIIFGVTSATLLVWLTFRLNEKYGTHGLMKLSARKSHPFHIINRKAISRLFHLKQASKMRNILKATTLENKFPLFTVENRVHRFQRRRHNGGVPGGTAGTVHRHGSRIRSDTFRLEQGGKGAARL